MYTKIKFSSIVFLFCLDKIKNTFRRGFLRIVRSLKSVVVVVVAVGFDFSASFVNLVG